MKIFQDILNSASSKALNRLHSHGVHILDGVKIHLATFSDCSYCLGYDPEDPVEIHVNGMRLSEAVISKSSREAMTEFLVHELGHAFLFMLWNTSGSTRPWDAVLTYEERQEFISLFGDYHSDGEGYKHRVSDTLRSILGMKPREFDRTRFASLYAVCSPHEDWAETFAYFIMGKPTPREKREYVEKLIAKYGR
jgi:hypothetical protein